jgi:phage terminase large subunit-like protein
VKFTTRKEANEFYADILFDAELNDCVLSVMAELGKKDLFFLLTRLLNRRDIQHDWLFERCKEVQQAPNNHLDLWAREHRKSTIITFALTIQDLVIDPELTFGIFSITRPLAKDFLEQIKFEFEVNRLLQQLYPDALFSEPRKESPKWSLDDGIVLRRKGNPREATIEAFGLVEGLPTGKHFNIRLYDDMIDEKNVTNLDIIKKAIQRWELSLNLGSDQIVKRYGIPNITRYIGTRYRYNDAYAHLLEKKAATPRIHPGTDTGKADGKPVYFSETLMAEKRREMGSYTFACQILLDPKADEVAGFNADDLQYWHVDTGASRIMNRYLLVDPASAKKKDSDFTSMWVIGLGEDLNYYLLDGVRDRLNLTERTTWLSRLHRKWRPLKTGYERYGQQADIEHIQFVQNQENYRFPIIPLGGSIPKSDRIRKLIPVLEAHRYYLPVQLIFIDYQKKSQDLTQIHRQELKDFPVGMYVDTLDCAARILDPDLGAVFPEAKVKLPFNSEVNKVKTDYDLFGESYGWRS